MRRLASYMRRTWELDSRQCAAQMSTEAAKYTVPIEIVSAISQRTHGVVQLPSEIGQVLEQHLGAGSKRGLRADSQALLHELRTRSRSVARGGASHLPAIKALQEAGEQERPKQKAGRIRPATWEEKVQMLTTPGLAMDLADTVEVASFQDAAADETGEDNSQWGEGTEARQQAAPQYNAQQAAAYIAARMPACYAAVYKVLEEVSMRLPIFTPQSMLDFGAGPGTAIWAAHEVYNGQPSSVLAVEPSLEMSRLGQRMHAARLRQDGKAQSSSAEDAHSSDIRWVSSLHGHGAASSAMRKQPVRRRRGHQQYDLVTGAYVLSELSSDAERRQTVQDLWDATKGILVMVEPGTPSGYQNVIAARGQVLESSVNAETGLREASVVAPCPHDGVCPMQGTRSWCHFVQRFERSSLQRVTKLRQGGGLARTYQDERFSYVVLRRGGRKAIGAPHAISRQRQDAGELHSPQPYMDAQPRSWRKSEARFQRALALEALMQEMGQLEDPEQESEVLEEATEFLIQQAIRVGDDEDDAEDALDPLQPTGATGSEVAAASLSDQQESLALNVEESRESYGSSAAPAAAARAHEDNSAMLGDSTRDPESEQNQEYEGLNSEGSGEEGELSEERMAEMALATAQQSSAWGRIIRPPRKKGRHVIVDLCAPTAVLPQHRQAELAASRQAAQASLLPKEGTRSRGSSQKAADGSLVQEGVLVRQVLASADRKTWLGPAGYALARNSTWGDLWPSFYINRAIISKIGTGPD